MEIELTGGPGERSDGLSWIPMTNTRLSFHLTSEAEAGT